MRLRFFNFRMFLFSISVMFSPSLSVIYECVIVLSFSLSFWCFCFNLQWRVNHFNLFNFFLYAKQIVLISVSANSCKWEIATIGIYGFAFALGGYTHFHSKTRYLFLSLSLLRSWMVLIQRYTTTPNPVLTFSHICSDSNAAFALMLLNNKDCDHH